MDKSKAYEILSFLKKTYPEAKIALDYSNHLELLISVMLSAQTTDTQVNKVMAIVFPKFKKEKPEFNNLYEKYSSIDLQKDELIEMINFAFSDILEIENEIKSIGLYKSKANNINKTSRILLEDYKGKLPRTIEEFTKLPGVGRKTANVVLGEAYGISEGVAVDTHVKRLARYFGFTKEEDPLKIERDLMALFDKKDWIMLTHLLIAHGRKNRNLKLPGTKNN